MAVRWSKRRTHTRHLPSEKRTEVRSSWIPIWLTRDTPRRSYRHRCPSCKAQILSVHMPNGGWAHFEGRKGMSRIKHPCLHMGEGLSRKRDDQTPDLFDTPDKGPQLRKK